MKPTKIFSLIVSTIVAASITFVLVKALISNGGSVPVAPNNLLISIPSIAIIETLAAIPVFRYRRELAKFATSGKRPKRIDPFYAVRILALAKATSISGALFAGFALSLVILQATLPVIPESIWLNGIALIESIVLIVVAIMIERACKLPEDGEAPAPEGTPRVSARLNIGIVGDGPVGKAFNQALGAAGHEMIQRKSIPDLLEFADLVIFAIPDDQLELTINGITEGKLWKPGQMVAHTSGRHGYSILNPASQAGSIPLAIHPAMKFTGTSSDAARIRESYFAVSAPAVALPIAQALVIEMGAEPITIAEENRAQYFEAISVASSFSSMIVNQSIGLLEEIGIEPAASVLAPLIRSSVEVALSQGHQPIDPTELLDK